MNDNEILQDYLANSTNHKFRLVCHNSSYYYEGQLCEKIENIPDGLELIDTIPDYPGGVWNIYEKGYIFGKTLGGLIKLKIIQTII